MTLNQRIEQWLLSARQDFYESAADGKNGGRPHVTLCYAQSWDGSITTSPGETLALSSDVAMEMTHQLRSLHDGIMVGIGTVLADDPRLTVRVWRGSDPQPIVMDSQLRMPPSSHLSQSDDRRCWVLTTPGGAVQRSDCEVIEVPGDADGRVALLPSLAALHERGIRSLMVEGGATVITAFLRAGLADAIVLTVAPLLVGGYKAVGRLGDSVHDTDDNAGPQMVFPRIARLHSEQLDNELIVWGKLCYSDPGTPGG